MSECFFSAISKERFFAEGAAELSESWAETVNIYCPGVRFSVGEYIQYPLALVRVSSKSIFCAFCIEMASVAFFLSVNPENAGRGFSVWRGALKEGMLSVSKEDTHI